MATTPITSLAATAMAIRAAATTTVVTKALLATIPMTKRVAMTIPMGAIALPIHITTTDTRIDARDRANGSQLI
jgi:hypothetical protein